jgi:hypothetical protein
MQAAPSSVRFGDILRLVLAEGKKQTPQAAAAALNMTLRAFHSKMRGAGRFDPDELSILLTIVTDERLPRWFFTGSDLLLVRRPIPAEGGQTATMPERTAACVVETLNAIDAVADALELSMQGERRPMVLAEYLDRAQGGLWSIQLHLAACYHAEPVPPYDRRESFPQLVQRALRKDRGISLQALSDGLGMKYNAFHARMSRRVGFTPDELKKMFLQFPDPRIADYLLSGTSYLAVLRPIALSTTGRGDPARLALDSMRGLLRFLGHLLPIGEMDLAMRTAVDKHLTEAVQSLALLRWRITHLGHPGALQSLEAGSSRTQLPATERYSVGNLPEPNRDRPTIPQSQMGLNPGRGALSRSHSGST